MSRGWLVDNDGYAQVTDAAVSDAVFVAGGAFGLRFRFRCFDHGLLCFGHGGLGRFTTQQFVNTPFHVALVQRP